MGELEAGRPVVLCILDGWGYREDTADNAVALGKTPVFDRLWAASPRCFLRTDGREVGLPDGQFGNSEVGHMNLGAGRVVMQELPRIDTACEDGSLAANAELAAFIEALEASGGKAHLMGLMSPGGVHSHQRHIAALARVLDGAGIEVGVHAFMDGRDTPPKAGADYVARFEDAISDLPRTKIVTVSGRYYAMDRDKRWERTELAYATLVDGAGTPGDSARAIIEAAYEERTGDEFIVPRPVAGYAGMADGDGLICANFRADRVRQILEALCNPDFDGFARPRVVDFAARLGMVSYSDSLNRFLPILFPPQALDDLLSEVVAREGLKQFHTAETEKYPHVTFFFNGGQETACAGEDRRMVPSPKVATYDLAPEMSAEEVTDGVVKAITSGDYAFVLINYANPDMVGHTGDLEAAKKAVATVDRGLGRLIEAVEQTGGCALVTADHGNCETMRDPATGQPHTAHTTNPVPCMLVNAGEVRLRDGRLADVAPTILQLLGLAQPAAMTGESLITEA